jgi:hypothetical protein
MVGNSWCYCCKNWIDKNNPYIVISCSSEEDCNNCYYFCDDSCVKIEVLRDIDFTKCNCCEYKKIKK